MNPATKRQPWVTMAVFESANDGQRLEVALKNKGYAARTYSDRLLQLILFLCPPRALFRVQVRENDLKNATEFLDKDPAAALLQKAVHCPACGSLRVQYPQMTRRFIMPTIMLHAGILLRIIGHEAYCEHCHFIWHWGEHPVPEPQAAGVHPK